MNNQRIRAYVVWATLVVIPLVVLVFFLMIFFLGGGYGELPRIIADQFPIVINTFGYGLAVTTLATLGGWALAHAQHNYRFFGRKLIHFTILISMAVPSFTFAMALLIMFGHNGWLTRCIGSYVVDIYGFWGMVISGSLSRMPYAYLPILLAYKQIDFTQYEVAVVLGVNRWRIMRKLIFTRLSPALLITYLLIFSDTVADLANPLVIGGDFKVLASKLYEVINGEANLKLATAYAMFLVIFAVLFGVAVKKLKYQNLSSSLAKDLTTPLPNKNGIFSIGFSWLCCLVVVLLFSAVIISAVSPPGEAFGFKSLLMVLNGAHTRSFAFSILMLLITLPLSLTAALLLVLVVTVKLRWIAKAEQWFTVMAAIPSLVLGLSAFLLFSVLSGMAVFSKPWLVAVAFGLIVVVNTLRTIPVAGLNMLEALRGLVPDIRETAILLRATPFSMIKNIYLPRLSEAIRAGTISVSARVLCATSSVILLAGGHVPLLTIQMLKEIDAGRLSVASAMTVIIGIVIGIILCLGNQGWRDERAT